MKITYILKDFTRKFLKKNKLKTEYDINNGNCDDWATEVNKIIPLTKILGTPDYYFIKYDWAVGHFWIKYKGKHYDAENINGVKNWKDLKIFKKLR